MFPFRNSHLDPWNLQSTEAWTFCLCWWCWKGNYYHLVCVSPSNVLWLPSQPLWNWISWSSSERKALPEECCIPEDREVRRNAGLTHQGADMRLWSLHSSEAHTHKHTEAAVIGKVCTKGKLTFFLSRMLSPQIHPKMPLCIWVIKSVSDRLSLSTVCKMKTGTSLKHLSKDTQSGSLPITAAYHVPSHPLSSLAGGVTP